MRVSMARVPARVGAPGAEERGRGRVGRGGGREERGPRGELVIAVVRQGREEGGHESGAGKARNESGAGPGTSVNGLCVLQKVWTREKREDKKRETRVVGDCQLARARFARLRSGGSPLANERPDPLPAIARIPSRRGSVRSRARSTALDAHRQAQRLAMWQQLYLSGGSEGKAGGEALLTVAHWHSRNPFPTRVRIESEHCPLQF